MGSQISLPGRRALLAQVVPYLTGLSVRLFANDFTPAPDDPDSAFIEPTFDGYAPARPGQLCPPFLNPQDYAETDGSRVTFRVRAGGGTDQIYGYWLADANLHWIIAERFAGGPVPMQITGQTCPVVVRVLSGQLP